MTEKDWRNCPDPVKLLRAIAETASERKSRLYLCAGCRIIAHLLYHPYSIAAVEAAERHVDSPLSAPDFDRAYWSADVPTLGTDFYPSAWRSFTPPGETPESVQILLTMGVLTTEALQNDDQVGREVIDRYLAAADLALQCLNHERPLEYPHFRSSFRLVEWPGAWLVRCIFGNPFRPAAVNPSWLEWNGGTVVKLARTIYEDRRWDLMPILGDALEDALCDNAEMLAHCRGPGPHARGCWVVDLILGKS